MPKLWITRRIETTKYVGFKKTAKLENDFKVKLKGYKCTIFYRTFTKTTYVPVSKHGANKREFFVFPTSFKELSNFRDKWCNHKILTQL